MNMTIDTHSQDVRELSLSEIEDVGGGVIFLLAAVGWFGAGAAFGAGVYLATEYLT